MVAGNRKMKDEEKTREQLIMELKNARDESVRFRESEEKFRNLVEQSLVGIYILQDGRIKYANPKSAEIFGYTQDELLAMHSVLEVILESDHPLVEENIRRRIQGETGSIHYSVRGKRKGGIPIDIEVHGTLTHYEGRPAIIGTLLDVTERRELEESLRVALTRAADEQARSEAIIAAIGDGISIQDRNFRVLYQNRIHRELVGEHVGEYCFRAYQGRDDVCDGCHVAMSFEDGMIHKKEQFRKTEKGAIYYEIVSSPLRDSKGAIIAGIEAVRDITERKRAAIEREKLIAELHDASANIRTLKGLLPICASCKRIRDDKGSWHQIEQYVRDRTDADFSHGICPECKKKFYPGF
jgi:PAS domain S-box-containing protein